MPADRPIGCQCSTYTGSSQYNNTPAVKASADGGAKGFVLSINYAHMRDQSLNAVGHALASLK